MEMLKKIFNLLFRIFGASSPFLNLNIGDKRKRHLSKTLTDIEIKHNNGDVNISGRDIHNGK